MDFTTVVTGTILICLYVLIPGVALSLAAFPKKEDLDLPLRIGISLFLGTIVPFTQYFLDKNLLIPINQSTTTILLFAATIAGLAVWQARLRLKPTPSTA